MVLILAPVIQATTSGYPPSLAPNLHLLVRAELLDETLWEFPKIRGSKIDPQITGLALQGHLQKIRTPPNLWKRLCPVCFGGLPGMQAEYTTVSDFREARCRASGTQKT